MHDVRITISGSQGTGKSLLAMGLAELLAELGIDVRLENESDDIDDAAERLSGFVQRDGMIVRIQTSNVAP